MMVRKDFWKSGAILSGLLLIVLLVQFITWARAVESAEAEAKAVIRTANPSLDWVFAEWERCNAGQGDYVKNGYITKEQCDPVRDKPRRSGRGRIARAVSRPGV